MTTALAVIGGVLILTWLSTISFFAIFTLRLSRAWRDVMVVLVDDEDGCDDSECAVCKLYRDNE